MLTYMIKVIQDLLISGFFCGLVFAALSIFKQNWQRRWIFSSILGAITVAFLFALLKKFAVIRKYEYCNIVFVVSAMVFAFVYLILSWIPAPKRFSKLWGWLNFASGSLFLFFFILLVLPNVWLYPAEFVLSDQSIVSTEFLFKLIGYLLGCLVIFLSSLSLYKVSLGLKKTFFHVCYSILFLVYFVLQFSILLQLLFGRRLIRPSKALFQFILFTINNSDLFLFLFVGITSLLGLIVFINHLKSHVSYENLAQKRRIRVHLRNKRRWSVALLFFYLLIVLSLTVLKSYNEREVVLSPAEPHEQVGNQLFIPLGQVEDGHLHRFAVLLPDEKTGSEVEVRFIVIKKNAVAYGIGLDACDICGATGYFERNDQVICKLCDVVMNINTIGYKGGCNPVPLPYTLVDGKIVIEISDLEAEKWRFQ